MGELEVCGLRAMMVLLPLQVHLQKEVAEAVVLRGEIKGGR